VIDSLSVTICGLPHPIISEGTLLGLDRGGARDWESLKRWTAPGKAGQSLQVRSVPGSRIGSTHATALQITGSPAKFLQGHNVFGCDDAPALVRECALRIVAAWIAEHPGSADDWQTFPAALDVAIATRPARTTQTRSGSDAAILDHAAPGVSIALIDVAYSLRVANIPAAETWLRHAKLTASAAYSRSVVDHGSTVYVGTKGGRAWRVKFYDKGSELRAKPPKPAKRGPSDPAYEHLPVLLAHASGLVRCELSLRSRELRLLGLTALCDWDEETAATLWQRYRERVNIPGQRRDALAGLALSRALQSTAQHWLAGADLAAQMSRATFFRHRRELLGFGLDIAKPAPRPDDAAPAPLRLDGFIEDELPAAQSLGLLWMPAGVPASAPGASSLPAAASEATDISTPPKCPA
jgi:hypothetical protein